MEGTQTTQTKTRCEGTSYSSTGHSSTGYSWARQCKNTATARTPKGHNACSSHMKAMKGYGAKFMDGTTEYTSEFF